MANLNGMKIKYLHFKLSDCSKYLSEQDQMQLVRISEKITNRRKEEGKNQDNTYLVINTDESYADEVIEIMKSNGHWG
ncbi:hypothetical protein P4571_08310 [Niallia alba]|uniref:hypothetical protein n=1 Tax=Niallia alba TaxID=2729105 RepID=UPI002E1BD6DF|nr:hypothetical protein [Niallia alba]